MHTFSRRVSHMRRKPSSPPVRRNSGRNAFQCSTLMSARCASATATAAAAEEADALSRRTRTSQMRSERSAETLASESRSRGDHCTSSTEPACAPAAAAPTDHFAHASAGSHTRTVPSFPPLARRPARASSTDSHQSNGLVDSKHEMLIISNENGSMELECANANRAL